MVNFTKTMEEGGMFCCIYLFEVHDNKKYQFCLVWLHV